MNAKEALERIEKGAASHGKGPRFVRTCAVGDQIRQGGIYVYPMLEPRRRGPAREGLHLGHGPAQPSRHALEGVATVYERRPAGPLTGPVIEARSRVTLTHPEHAPISLPPGWYEVTYQRDFSSERSARVPD